MNDNHIPEENEPLDQELDQSAIFDGGPLNDESGVDDEFSKEFAEEVDELLADGDAEEDPLSPVHERLTVPETANELTADDHAMYSAGLTHPEDAEFKLPESGEEPLPQEEPFRDEEYQEAFGDGKEFQEMFEGKEAPADEDPSAIPHHDRPAHKGRPKRRKGDGLFGIPHLVATLIWLGIIVAIGVSLGRMIWVCAADVLAFGRESKEVTVTITAEDLEAEDYIEIVADKLYDAGLIRYPGLFKLYAGLAVDEGEIGTGTFTLNTIYDYHALVNQMSPNSTRRVVVEDVLIPEGYTCRQIFALLEEKGVCKAADLEEYAANGELSDYWFLEDVERGDKYCLEGYLFPDTYDFYENDSPQRVLEKMLNNFENRFTGDMQAQISTLNDRLAEMMRDDGRDEAYIASNQIGLHELVTVASMIEKETANSEESYKIASVIYNRLFCWGSTPRYLNIDASVIYALNGKTDLTAEDMSVDSPYNTYTNTGLTPGPISNPGIASLKAALDPADTDYYYYVLDPDAGEHTFNKTYEDHEKAIEEVNARSTETNE